MPALRHTVFFLLLILGQAGLFDSTVFQQTTTHNSVPVVNLGLQVIDRDNHPVDDLSKDEIQLSEDDKPQTVGGFAKDTRPRQIAIAVDCSGSFKTLLAPALDFVKLMIIDRPPEDETALIRFINSDKIETVQDFTSDRLKLVDSLTLFKSEMGQSAVNDAIYLAVNAVAERRPSESRRRVVIVITDGEERASYYTTDQVLKLLRLRDVQVYVVGIVLQLNDKRSFARSSPQQAAETLLKKVAGESGGKVFFPRTNGDLLKAAEEINHDLHAQYLISFQPTNVDKRGFRKVEVKITSPRGKDIRPIARSGYFINPPNVDKDQKREEK